jgi:hypothetical protein
MPTAFFGIGAMRSGTTWLSDLLDTYPDCAMMPFKEMHFFDVRYGYGAAQFFGAKSRQIATIGNNVAKRIGLALEQVGKSEGPENPVEPALDDGTPKRTSVNWTDDVRREFFAHASVDEAFRQITKLIDLLSIRDLESYRDYLRRHGNGAAAFGEITPAYGILPAAAFSEMDGLFADARFIFIMRDPVDRLWSHVRFRLGKGERRGHNQRDPNHIFRKMLQSRGAIARSSYRHTIQELESVVPADRILYLFYESLTSPQRGPVEAHRIETALGLDPLRIDEKFWANPVNSSPPAALNAENERLALEVFSPVYAFVEQRFGRPWGWRSPGGAV